MHMVWEAALEELRGRLSEHTFVAWLAPLRFVAFEAPVLRVRIPHRFFADWISPRYLPDLLETMARLSGEPCTEIDWVIDPLEATAPRASSSEPPAGAASSQEPVSAQLELDAPEPAEVRWQRQDALAARRASARPQPRRPDRRTGELPFGSDAPVADRATPAPRVSPPPAVAREDESGDYALNPRYRFDSFIVGPSNQLAHAASIAASSSPGKRYNPLFIYSKVGLGKTHLVNAVGHRVREDRPSARVLFLSAERFTNEFISALQHRRIDEFRARYRTGCDVLVIDDIQFLAGREQTQEEFFHTFNALYHADKQIVVTSDVYPQQIKEMQDRLISRFQWGLVADIQAPELDTRIAILRKKAETESIHLDDAVALFVAQRVQSNVRELEGTLLRLAVRADVEGKSIDLDLARAMLGEPTHAVTDRQTSVEDIQRATCEFFGLGMKELLGDRRHRGVSLPRMIAMFIAREKLRLSYPDIGRRFGGKDHTTVISAHRKIGALVLTDEQVQRAVDRIQKKLGL
ncbi:MAG: chromosomal replication initiator protein DnaA [Sandaracinaceae bacterium]|nr:chromosomal replication initiator protein DnaA [Sandaracinaceae bacterium]